MNEIEDKSGFIPYDQSNASSFEDIIQENFTTFYLFHEVFSKPACYRMNPLLAFYPWKPQTLRMFHM